MNDIVKPLTPDGMCGWDAHGQLWIWKPEGKGKRGTIIGDPRGHKCRICLQGWTLTVESLEDQEYWDSHEEWVHLSCSVRYAALQERDMWYGALIEAGIRFHGFEEIPNEYCPNTPFYGRRPWYRVALIDSRRTLKLGRRKRVYSMEIESAMPGAGLYSLEQAQELLKAEDVTKEIRPDGLLIHAWGRDKAREYVKAFAKILDLGRKPQPAGGA